MSGSEESDKPAIIEKPKTGKGDVAHMVVRAGLSAIPILGGTATEVFTAIIAPPIIKRRTEWIESIVKELERLKEKVDGLKIEDLSQNETFITTITYATMIALRNHKREKIEALRNAVLNTVLSSEPDEDLNHMFLNFVDVFTPWHIRILKFFNNPREWGQKNNIIFPNFSMGPPSAVLEHAFPKLKGSRDFYDQVARDLSNRGLMSNGSSLHTGMTASGMFDSRTTKMGKQFIQFISFPIEKV